MTDEMILNAGIDIGTTTTHLIISKIGIRVTGGFGTVPRAQISSKEILYKSPVYFTPLLGNGEIDGKKVAAIIADEYKTAGISPHDLKSGAVIVTGESACKGNASYVLHEISELAGDFIAAQAGSELESYLSGKGSSADVISRETGKLTANIDIGGGTTNISLFENGKCLDTCCLNIGGRQIKRNGNAISFSEIVAKLISDSGIAITDLERDRENVYTLCGIMADCIFSALGYGDKNIPGYLVTDHLLKTKKRPDILTFSGGVAECMDGKQAEFAYGDIGVILGKAVERNVKRYGCEVFKNNSTPIRATVIGAGQFSMEISGSTIQYSGMKFPLKNLPCLCSLDEIGDFPCVICPKGEKAPSFSRVRALAQDIAAAANGMIEKNIPLVVMTREDYSKALGQCLKRELPDGYPFLCADGIDCKKGDYVDIGEPVADGRAVPVVVKTLVFGG